MPQNIQYEVPTWNQLYDLLIMLAQKIHADGFKPDMIVGISRGGVIPSRILTDLLQTKELATITIEHYNGIGQKHIEAALKQCLNTPIRNKKALVVDDISDTGRSLSLAKAHLQNLGAKEIKTATIYCKPNTTTTPDYYEKQTSYWIVFPWEAKETLTAIMQTNSKLTQNKELAKLINAGFPNNLAKKLLKDDGGNPP